MSELSEEDKAALEAFNTTESLDFDAVQKGQQKHATVKAKAKTVEQSVTDAVAGLRQIIVPIEANSSLIDDDKLEKIMGYLHAQVEKLGEDLALIVSKQITPNTPFSFDLEISPKEKKVFRAAPALEKELPKSLTWPKDKKSLVGGAMIEDEHGRSVPATGLIRKKDVEGRLVGSGLPVLKSEPTEESEIIRSLTIEEDDLEHDAGFIEE